MTPETITHVLHEPLAPIVVLAVLSAIGALAGYAYAAGYDRGHARASAVARDALGERSPFARALHDGAKPVQARHA